MAITLASTAHGNTTTQNLTINKPTGGWVAGSVLIACACGEDASNVGMSTPAGWTRLDGDSTNTFSQNFYHVCGASEPASYTWSTSAATNHAFAVCILEYSGVDNAAPINAHSIHTGNSADKTIVWDSTTTTTVNGCKIVAIGAVEVNRVTPTLATPTGYTAEVSDNSGLRAANSFMGAVFCFDKDQATAGALGSTNALITTTSTAANTYWAGYFVALKPGSTGPQTYNVSQSESASGADVQAAITTTSAAQSEAGSSADVNAGGLLLNVTDGEAAAAAESQNGAITKTASGVEAATGTDLQSAQAGFVANDNETGSANDNQSALSLATAAITEAVSAADSQDVQILVLVVADLTEAASALESQSAIVDFVAQVIAPATATDDVSAILNTDSQVAETGVAVDATVAGLDIVAVLVEAGAADDVTDRVRVALGDLAEGLTALDVFVGQSDAYIAPERPNSISDLIVVARLNDVNLRAVAVAIRQDRLVVVRVGSPGILTVPARVVTLVKR